MCSSSPLNSMLVWKDDKWCQPSDEIDAELSPTQSKESGQLRSHRCSDRYEASITARWTAWPTWAATSPPVPALRRPQKSISFTIMNPISKMIWSKFHRFLPTQTEVEGCSDRTKPFRIAHPSKFSSSRACSAGDFCSNFIPTPLVLRHRLWKYAKNDHVSS